MNRNVWAMGVVLAVSLSASFAADSNGNGGIYVAPNGADTNPGTKDKPFLTLEKARDAARQLKGSGGIVVTLRGGTYLQPQTFELTEADSGVKGSPVVYRAAEGEEARIVSARVVTAADFKPVTDPEILKRIDGAAQGKVLCLDLEALKIDHAGPYPNLFGDGGKIIELFFNGKRMPISRWPNEGYVTMAKVLDPGDSNKATRHGGVFTYREDRPSRWNVEEGVWLKGFWRVPWEIQAVKVKSLDAGKKEIALLEPVPGGIGSKYAKGGGSGKEPWCAINLLEEIDSPGEWCIHFKSKKLFFYPPAPLAGASIMISDQEKPIIAAKNTSNLTLRGLTLEGGMGNAIEITGGANNLVAGCTIRNMAKTGVIIKGGTSSGVAGCDIYDMGWGGVSIGGGDRKKLIPCGNYAVNNDIHDFGVLRKTYAPGVEVGSYGSGDAVGCRVANNTIHDAPHAGILYGGNDNLLEYNEIYRIALDSGDVGAMYTWNDWTSRGNVVQYNFFHDSPNANGVYMDDGDSGDTVVSNVFYKMQCGPFIGGGHDNIIRNNIIVECSKAIHFDSRGVSRLYATNKKMINLVKDMNPKQPPWSTRYPEMADLLESQPDMPRGDVIETNVAVNCPKVVNQSGPKEHFTRSKVQDNIGLTLEEAAFADFAKGDFHLKADSVVFKKLPAFKPIPFEKIGLYLDKYRTKLPGKTSAGSTGPRENFNSETDMQHSNKKK